MPSEKSLYFMRSFLRCQQTTTRLFISVNSFSALACLSLIPSSLSKCLWRITKADKKGAQSTFVKMTFDYSNPSNE